MNAKSLKIDLHVHTNLSPCSRMGIDEIIDHAVTAGLDGIGITDHDTMQIKRYVHEGKQENGLYVFIGMEYTTPEGDFLLYGPFQNVPSKLPASDLLNWVQNENGVAIAAHPFRKNRSTHESVFGNRLCHIAEGVNGRNSDIENLKANTLQEKYRIQLTGGSDAHEPYEIGKVFTRFQSRIHSKLELIQALKTKSYHPAVHLNHPILSQAASACL